MFDFIKKSPLGFALTVTAFVLAVSPEARESARKFAVKGSTAFMDFVDSIKNPQISNPPVPEFPLGEAGENTSAPNG